MAVQFSFCLHLPLNVAICVQKGREDVTRKDNIKKLVSSCKTTSQSSNSSS